MADPRDTKASALVRRPPAAEAEAEAETEAEAGREPIAGGSEAEDLFGEEAVELSADEGEAESEADLGEPEEREPSPEPIRGGAGDPLQAYLRRIGRHPLVDRAEERELARRFREEGDIEAGEKLALANLRLVVKIAFEYRRSSLNVLDLIQEGNLGLLEAVKRFDPERGVRLSSYAAWWIRAYLLRFILNNWRLVRIGATRAERKLFYNLRKEQARLEREGKQPDPAVLAERLGVEEHEVSEMAERLRVPELSLDRPLAGTEDEEGGATLLERLPGPDEGRPDATAEMHELQERLREKYEAFESELAGRDRLLFRERLMAEEPETLQELGTELGISRERVRQLEERIVRRLRSYLEAELGEEVGEEVEEAAPP